MEKPFIQMAKPFINDAGTAVIYYGELMVYLIGEEDDGNETLEKVMKVKEAKELGMLSLNRKIYGLILGMIISIIFIFVAILLGTASLMLFSLASLFVLAMATVLVEGIETKKINKRLQKLREEIPASARFSSGDLGHLELFRYLDRDMGDKLIRARKEGNKVFLKVLYKVEEAITEERDAAVNEKANEIFNSKLSNPVAESKFRKANAIKLDEFLGGVNA